MGLTISVRGLDDVNRDARVLVVGVTVLATACAVGAAMLVTVRPRSAGEMLIASAAMPTYFEWVINLPGFAAGVALLFLHPSTTRTLTPRPQ